MQAPRKLSAVISLFTEKSLLYPYYYYYHYIYLYFYTYL